MRLVLLLLLALSRPAAADRSVSRQIENLLTNEDGDPNGAGQVAIALYVVSIAGGAVVDAAGAKGDVVLPRAYGIGEAAFHLPIAAAWTVGFVHELQSTSDHTRPAPFAVFAVIDAALAAHGIYTVINPRRRRATEVVALPAEHGATIGLAGTF